MDIATIDFETYYDKDYSLSKMSTEEYVRDPRFEVIGVGIKLNGGETDWYSGENFGAFLNGITYSDKAILAHNTAFDGAILSWHFGIRPKLWLDTMSMAKPYYGMICGVSLKALANALGVGQKGDEVINALGKRRAAFSPSDMARYADYCKTDVDLTYALFRKLAKRFPTNEYIVVDQTIRMFTEPKIELDTDLLRAHLNDVRVKKEKLLDAVQKHTGDATRDALKARIMSNPQFAALLEQLGVEPPQKISKTTGKPAFAFAKTDAKFKELETHDNPVVQALVAARLGNRSTIEETRTESFLEIASRGTLPVQLNYYGAHCVPGDTEVLTLRGWERLDTWTGGDIAQWEPSGNIAFLPATRFVGPSTDQWIRSEAPYMPVSMTLGHTVPVLTHTTFKHKTLEAAALANRTSTYVPTSGMFIGQNNTITAKQMRVLAMVQADGSWETDTRIGRKLEVFLKKPRKIDRARKILAAADVLFEEQVYPSHPDMVRFIIRWRDLPDWLTPERKFFGSWLLDATPEALSALMAELTQWDGFVHNGSDYYSSSVKDNAEWIRTIAHLTGFGANISVKPAARRRQPNYNVAIRKRPYCMVRGTHMREDNTPRVTYCTKTQTGFWLARANGQVFVTGNTGRFSGAGGVNLQNLGRKSPLRKALRAPEGYVFIPCDSSQIEARMLACIAGQDDLLEDFRAKKDIYSEFATVIYGYLVTKQMQTERFVGKTSILGLGYGMGGPRFRETLRIGNGGISVNMALEEATAIVYKYRRRFPAIERLWKRAGEVLAHMAQGGSGTFTALNIRYEGEKIFLPNGMELYYPFLTANRDGFSYIANSRAYMAAATARLTGQPVEETSLTYIYGAKMIENLTQALARIVISEQMAVIAQRYPVVLQVHDENVPLVPEAEGEKAKAWVEGVMSVPPKWAPHLPVACEAGMGKTYGDGKS